MTPIHLSPEHEAVLTVALMGALADGQQSDAERQQVRDLARSLGGEAMVQRLPALITPVMLRRLPLAELCSRIQDPDLKHLAYELAVGVCESDGPACAAEQRFLQELREHLALRPLEVQQVHQIPDAVSRQLSEGLQSQGAAAVSVAALASGANPPAASSEDLGLAPGPIAASPVVDEAELDRRILKASVINGALELLPQSWATMAIVPLQMRLVHQMGVAYGYRLDSGHIREFVATAGLGLGSQYLEQMGRKLVGGLLGKVAGGLGRGVGRAATGMAFSFASTWAIGQLARRYYAGGRQMNTAMLKETYQSLLGQGKQLQGRHLPQIEQQARSIKPADVMQWVKGA